MKWAAGLLVLTLVLAGCASPEAGTDGDPPATTPPPTSGPSSDEKGPDWAFVDIDGVAHARDEPESNATVMFFMASWCGSCRTKAPMLARVHEDLSDGVRWYSLSWDASDDERSLRDWQKQYSNSWPHAVDPEFKTQRTFGITSQSSVLVLDGDGRVVQKWSYGLVTENGLRDAIERARAA